MTEYPYGPPKWDATDGQKKYEDERDRAAHAALGYPDSQSSFISRVSEVVEKAVEALKKDLQREGETKHQEHLAENEEYMKRFAADLARVVGLLSAMDGKLSDRVGAAASAVDEEAGIRHRQYADLMRLITEQGQRLDSIDENIKSLFVGKAPNEWNMQLAGKIGELETRLKELQAIRPTIIEEIVKEQVEPVDKRIDVQQALTDAFARRIRGLEKHAYGLGEDEEIAEVSAAAHMQPQWPEQVDKEVPVKKRAQARSSTPRVTEMEVWGVREKSPEAQDPEYPNQYPKVLYWTSEGFCRMGYYNLDLKAFVDHSASGGYSVTHWAYLPEIER